MEFENVIAERYSVRKFKNIHLEKETVDKILKAGHLAPTGCNFQPQRILVLNTDKSMEELKKCTKCHFDAPCAMIVCYNKNETWKRPYDGAISAPIDASIVATHMMLEAQNLGIGSCWVMHFDPYATKNTFNIPDYIEPLAILVLGLPRDDASPSEMHEKFRPINDIIFYESF